VAVDLPAREHHPSSLYTALVLDAITVALSGRIQVDPASGATPEHILHELWEEHFLQLAAAPPADGPAIAADTPIRRPGTDKPGPTRRKPKQLDNAPQLFVPTPDEARGGGLALRSRDTPPPANARADRTAGGLGDETGGLVAIPAAASDPEVAARANEIATRLSLRRRGTVRHHPARGEWRAAPYDGGSDDIDLEATLEVLLELPTPAADDIVVRQRLLHRRAVALLVDISGSMRGERVRTAAATVGALAGELQDDQLSVVAFWSDAALLLALGDRVEPADLMETLLRLPARGLTNVAFPLEVARDELSRAQLPDGRALLLSDCVHNAGPDPRATAAGLGRLDVLLDVSGEHDADLGRELARAGRGRCIPVRTHRDVAPALDAIFVD
jgi:Mg-chelatase subunit ChlD